VATPPNNERANSGFWDFWKSLPGVLTGVAAVIGAVAALGALFFGGDDNEPRTSSVIRTPTPTPAPTYMGKLLAMLPTPLQDSCEEESGFGDELARVECDRFGATFYYELHKDALEARYSFGISTDVAEEDAPGQAGQAKTCRDATARKPFVGTWEQPGRSRPAGQLLCTFDPGLFEGDGIAEREWTVAGRPILASLLYSGDRESAADGAYRAWRSATP
jgi:hypothetical protein